ncbi:MAG: hypothetical protein U1E29_02765 [Coriobacteriia bacterium]|nr:hypothetical protein [Coriobacteriia bacterium]
MRSVHGETRPQMIASNLSDDRTSRRDATGRLGVNAGKRWIVSAGARLLIGFAAITCALMLWRLRYGIGLTDEAFYMALPWRFVLGDRPFVDELNFMQTAGMLVAPLVYAWTKVMGSTDGLVLFMRTAWFTLAATTAVVAFRLYGRLLPKPLALALSMVYVTLVPFTIPNLSYNTLGGGLLTLGLGLLAIELLDHRDRWWIAAVAAICHAFAVFAYPSMIVLAIIASAILVMRRDIPGYMARAYVLSLTVFAILFTGVLAALGFDGVASSVEYTRQLYPFFGGSQKLSLLLQQVWRYDRMSIAVVVAVLSALTLARKRAPAVRAMSMFVPVLTLWVLRGTPGVATLLWVPILGLFGLVLSRLDPMPEFRSVLMLVGSVSIAGGMLTAYTSTNGVFNAAIGMSPIFLVAFPSIFRAGLSRDELLHPSRWAAAVMATGLMLAALVFLNYQGAYGSVNSPSAMRSQANTGPFMFMLGTDDEVAFVQTMQSDVDRYVGPQTRVLFYYDMIGGYLMSQGRVSAPSAWFGIGPGADLTEVRARPVSRLLRSVSTATLPDVVFVKRAEVESEELHEPFWYTSESARYERVLQRDGYDVFVRVDDAE